MWVYFFKDTAHTELYSYDTLCPYTTRFRAPPAAPTPTNAPIAPLIEKSSEPKFVIEPPRPLKDLSTEASPRFIAALDEFKALRALDRPLLNAAVSAIKIGRAHV